MTDGDCYRLNLASPNQPKKYAFIGKIDWKILFALIFFPPADRDLKYLAVQRNQTNEKQTNK